MKINHLHIQNIFCFKEADFTFSPGFNLLAGINGSGKTSLLKSIATILVRTINAVTGAHDANPTNERNLFRLEMRETQGKIRFELCFPAGITAEGVAIDQAFTWQDRLMDEQGKIINYLSEGPRQIAPIGQTEQNKLATLPLAVFYSAQRQWELANIKQEVAVTNKDSRLDAYASWRDASTDINRFETWLITKSLERLETLSSDDPDAARNDELTIVNGAIANAMIGSKGLRYDIRQRRLLLEWHSGEPTPFELLSDGQKALCALIADIARRICLLNPHLGDLVLKDTPGIVLIDELDMHLHPAWQRRMPNILKETFPKIQFIVASHSPQILGELLPEEIILLRPEGGTHPQLSYGLDASSVLEDIMDAPARSTKVAQALKSLFAALEQKELEPARQQLVELKQLAPGIAEIAGAQALLRRKEVLGR